MNPETRNDALQNAFDILTENKFYLDIQYNKLNQEGSGICSTTSFLRFPMLRVKHTKVKTLITLLSHHGEVIKLALSNVGTIEEFTNAAVDRLIEKLQPHAGDWNDSETNPFHPDYIEVVEPTPIEIDHSVSLVEVESIELLDTEEAPIMVLEEYVTSDADVDESEEWTGFYGLPDFANWIDFEIIKMHANAPQAEELSKIFDTTIDLARGQITTQNIYIKIGDAACYGEAELQYFPGWGFYVTMKSINYFVGDPEAVAGDDLFLAADGNIYAIEATN